MAQTAMPTADPREPAAAGMETEGSASVRTLTRAIAQGDTEAFGAFYESWFDRTLAMARSVSRRDESFCLDIVQDTMLRVVRYLKPLPSEKSLANWIARAVLTTTIDRLRKDNRRPAREREAACRLFEQGGERIVDEEQIEWLQAQLEVLPELDRQLIRERFHHGRTLQETGTAVGLSGHAAHGRIRRIIERLRRAAKEVFS